MALSESCSGSLCTSFLFSKGIVLEDIPLQGSKRLLLVCFPGKFKGRVRKKKEVIAFTSFLSVSIMHMYLYIYLHRHTNQIMCAYIYMAVLISKTGEFFLVLLAQPG